ncbi:MAG TPA: aminotransferase class I/II-fold pyridoxal phosphate-dependent enzyme [Terriglobales bacterium]|nr:aminotransferase class I/II-fold pyridoxal phosphate-dependent enzyme [Terriglobales bacterium]
MTTAAMTTATAILPARRLDEVRYAIRDLAVLADQVAKTGMKILPLNIGDPLKFDFVTPPHMVEAVERAMRDGKNGYAPSSGTGEAVQAIRREAERKGIHNILDVFVTSGASEAVDICLNALLNEDENVLCPEPEYPLYTAVVAKMGLKPNSYALNEENGWQPDFADIERKITPKTRGLVFINPNNPTGAIYSRETLERLAEIARRHNLVVFADEIYDKLVLEGEHISLAAIAPDVPVVTFGGLSKNYLAPGWRIGWGVVSGPKEITQPYVDGINKLLRSRLCASHPMMWAIKPALDGPQDHLTGVLAKLRSRADLTIKWATETPRVSCVAPKGAFYAYPKLDIPEPDEEFVKKLLRETGVLLVHGSGFGQAPGTKHARVVFLPDEATLTAAYDQIAQFMKRHYA